LIGQDLEFFLKDKGSGEIVPAHEFFPPKSDPIHVGGDNASVLDQIYRDGYAVEINTRPGHCRVYQWQGVTATIQRGLEKSGAAAAGVYPTTDPIAHIDLKALKGYPDDVKEFGCEPAINAYTGEKCIPPKKATEAPFRTAGGHMHVTAFTESQIKDKNFMCTFTKLCDLLIGLPGVIIFGDDMEFQRRELYGKAGEFRIKRHKATRYNPPYWGHEYRVMSPRMWRTPATASLCFGIYRDVIHGNMDELIKAWNKSLAKPLQEAINTGKGAVELLEEWEKILKPYDEQQRRTIRVIDRATGRYNVPYSSLHHLTVKALKKAYKEFSKAPEGIPYLPGETYHDHKGWNDTTIGWGIK
jgi:hypothetical protein